MSDYEQGPIRPPSESKSLLIRATRNCPWNRCEFCHTYKGERFQIRPVDEIKQDIRKVREIADDIRDISRRLGHGGEVNNAVIRTVYDQPFRYGESYRSVATWLYFGGSQVFIQDANSLIMETEDLLVILKFLKEMFPRISRMTSYARTKTLARKTVEELTALHGAGLSRIHVGFETGYDPLLTYIRKGVTSREEEEAGKKVISSGISLCVYVMPGLGGQKWTLEHAVESARVLNQINPHHIRLRTLHVQPSMGIYEKIQSGEMKLLDEDDVVREIRVFVAHLEGVQSYIISDHILNLLEEIEGRLPQDREKLLGSIDRYLSLPEEERLIFKFGRRAGIYRSLDELQEMEPHQRIERAIGRLGEMEPQKIEMTLRSMMDNFI